MFWPARRARTRVVQLRGVPSLMNTSRSGRCNRANMNNRAQSIKKRFSASANFQTFSTSRPINTVEGFARASTASWGCIGISWRFGLNMMKSYGDMSRNGCEHISSLSSLCAHIYVYIYMCCVCCCCWCWCCVCCYLFVINEQHTYTHTHVLQCCLHLCVCLCICVCMLLYLCCLFVYSLVVYACVLCVYLCICVPMRLVDMKKIISKETVHVYIILKSIYTQTYTYTDHIKHIYMCA